MTMTRENPTPSNPSGQITQNSTHYILSAIHQHETLKVETPFTINDELVTNNRRNKLHGTFGETIVVFHETASALGGIIRALQDKIKTRLGEAVQNPEGDNFSTVNGKIADNTHFAPIYNPHTTIIAMRVVDAVDEQSWDERLAQSYLYAKFSQYKPSRDEQHDVADAMQIIMSSKNLDDMLYDIPAALIRNALGIKNDAIKLRKFILSHSHSSLIYSQTDQLIVKKILLNPVISLTIESIVLGPNGSLGIRWKKNDEISQLRKSLTSIGGMSKHGDDIITTTLGYFPYCQEKSKDVIKPVLEEILQELHIAQICRNDSVNHETEHTLRSTFELNLKQAKLVKFARNDLHHDFISSSTLIIDDHLSKDIDDAKFPETLSPQQQPHHTCIPQSPSKNLLI